MIVENKTTEFKREYIEDIKNTIKIFFIIIIIKLNYSANIQNRFP